MKLQQNKDEVPQETLILRHFHIAGHQLSGTANVAALEITQMFFYVKKCLSFYVFVNV
jgi:hypothetical protein